MNRKSIALIRLFPLLIGCSQSTAEFLYDDNGFPYTAEELTQKNTFRSEKREPDDTGDIPIGVPVNDAHLIIDRDTEGKQAVSGPRITFTIGVGLNFSQYASLYLSVVPYLYCQFGFPDSSKDFGYKAVSLPEIEESSYHVFSLSVNKVFYRVYDVCLDFQIDFTSCYSILGDGNEAKLTITCLAPKENETLDFAAPFFGNQSVLCSDSITYQFRFENSGKDITVSR